jgi:hypothetical protein
MSFRQRNLILCAVLAALVLAIYCPVRYHPFVCIDDEE